MTGTLQRTVLISGGNKGIGLETARQLLVLGHIVIIGSRDLNNGQRAVGGLPSAQAHAIQLDVTNPASIAAAMETIKVNFGRIDSLVNNAGVLLYPEEGVASTVTDKALRDTFETNFFGLVALTRAALPLLRLSTAGRIVNVTSILGSIAEHADPNSPIYHAKFLAYDASKAAVNMFTNHLAHELKGTSIKVNAGHPGWVKTDMGGENAPMAIVDGAKTSVQLATLPDDGPSGGFYHMGVHMRW
jgi:NAD(P)-dependent dehydrogenase (short-subunit alcohol dehydrogenase family)